MKTGIAHLPLHSGKAPPWLFERMKKLAREIVRVMLYEFDSVELMQRLFDPFWFQALGCVLGFDWHSSGLTTTVCGALKEGIKGMEHELGFFIGGGKGRVSRRTPDELMSFGKHLRVAPEPLVYASRMSAKVDSAAVQDGYQLYHHVFFFNCEGQWTVVQQGMNDANGCPRAITGWAQDLWILSASRTRQSAGNPAAKRSIWLPGKVIRTARSAHNLLQSNQRLLLEK